MERIAEELGKLVLSQQRIADALEIIAQGSEIAYGRVFAIQEEIEAFEAKRKSDFFALGNLALAAGLQVKSYQDAEQMRVAGLGQILKRQNII